MELPPDFEQWGKSKQLDYVAAHTGIDPAHVKAMAGVVSSTPMTGNKLSWIASAYKRLNNFSEKMGLGKLSIMKALLIIALGVVPFGYIGLGLFAAIRKYFTESFSFALWLIEFQE